MDNVQTGDLLAYGLLILSIYIFIMSLGFENSLLKFFGLIASSLIFIAEVLFIKKRVKGGR